MAECLSPARIWDEWVHSKVGQTVVTRLSTKVLKHDWVACTVCGEVCLVKQATTPTCRFTFGCLGFHDRKGEKMGKGNKLGNRGNSFFDWKTLRDKLVAVKLIELGESNTKYGRKPFVLVKLAVIHGDGSASIVSTSSRLFPQVLVDVLGEANPDDWYTGRFVQPNNTWFWNDNRSEEESLCSQAIENLELTEKLAGEEDF